MSARRDHIIVVGAGVGGLAAAIQLAAAGKRVSLIEQHEKAGGKIHQTCVDDRMIDTGPTVFTMRWVFEALYARAGLKFEEHVRLKPADVLARHSWIGSDTLDLHADIERTTAAIAEFAGGKDASHYQTFAARSESIFGTLDKTFMQAQRPNPASLTLAIAPLGLNKLLQASPFITLWRALGKQFNDPRLRQLFARYATYCGSSPFESPAILMLIAHAERAGVWSIDGGMQSLADSLLQVAQTSGCDCRFGTSVERINTELGKVTGVTLADGTRIDSDAVVFNGDTRALSQGLLGDSLPAAARTRSPPSLSAITRSQVASTAGFDLSLHNVFFCDHYQQEFDDVFTHRRVPRDPTVYVCAQDRTMAHPLPPPGASAAPEGASSPAAERLFSLINAPARNLSREEIDIGKKAMSTMLQQHGLVISGEQGETHTATPNDFGARFPASEGALYGRPTHGWMSSFRRPGARANIRGLYCAGGTVHPGAGVPMAALSGGLAADCVISDQKGR